MGKEAQEDMSLYEKEVLGFDLMAIVFNDSKSLANSEIDTKI